MGGGKGGRGRGVAKCQAEIQVQEEIYELPAKFISAQGPRPYFTHPQDWVFYVSICSK